MHRRDRIFIWGTVRLYLGNGSLAGWQGLVWYDLKRLPMDMLSLNLYLRCIHVRRGSLTKCISGELAELVLEGIATRTRQKRKYAFPISKIMEQLKLALANKEAEQLFMRDERDRDRWDRYTYVAKAEARFSNLKGHAEQLKLELATKKAKQLFIRDERDRDRWDRYTHETNAEARFSIFQSQISWSS